MDYSDDLLLYVVTHDSRKIHISEISKEFELSQEQVVDELIALFPKQESEEFVHMASFDPQSGWLVKTKDPKVENKYQRGIFQGKVGLVLFSVLFALSYFRALRFLVLFVPIGFFLSATIYYYNKQKLEEYNEITANESRAGVVPHSITRAM